MCVGENATSGIVPVAITTGGADDDKYYTDKGELTVVVSAPL